MDALPGGRAYGIHRRNTLMANEKILVVDDDTHIFELLRL